MLQTCDGNVGEDKLLLRCKLKRVWFTYAALITHHVVACFKAEEADKVSLEDRSLSESQATRKIHIFQVLVSDRIPH